MQIDGKLPALGKADRDIIGRARALGGQGGMVPAQGGMAPVQGGMVTRDTLVK